MDGPTAALGLAEAQRVEELIRRMRDRGRAILLVSPSLDSVPTRLTGSAFSGAEQVRQQVTRSSRMITGLR